VVLPLPACLIQDSHWRSVADRAHLVPLGQEPDRLNVPRRGQIRARPLSLFQSRQSQMIRHMRHGSSSRLMVLQLSASPIPENPQATPSAGVRITHPKASVAVMMPAGGCRSPARACGPRSGRRRFVQRPATTPAFERSRHLVRRSSAIYHLLRSIISSRVAGKLEIVHECRFKHVDCQQQAS
jgi:hypothetical protein